MADIFLSYAYEDRETAGRIGHALETYGWQVWWEPLLTLGETWEEVARREIHSAKCVIVLWSPRSRDRQRVLAQARFARQRQILIPAMIGTTVAPVEFDDLRAVRLTDWTGDFHHPGFADLIGAIRLLARPRDQVALDMGQNRGPLEVPSDLATLPPLRGHLHATQKLMWQIDRLVRGQSLEGLREVKAAQIDLADELFGDRVPAAEIQQLLTAINNHLYRRVCDTVVEGLAADGWGPPPVTVTTIVMGSGGRGENYLYPDQDNGFILGDYEDAEHTTIDTWFREMAERMCTALNDVGIPYCNGYCMAVNPLWRKTLPQWTRQISLWGEKLNFVAIRLADIFFDFQAVWGESSMADALRRAVTEMAQDNTPLLRQMFANEVAQNLVLDFFGGFLLENDKAEYKGHINLKYHGTIPLVETMRLMALRAGVPKTSTLDRIRGLHDKGDLDADERNDLASAYYLITDVLLKKQINEFKTGRRVSYYLDPKTLTKSDRVMLLESLRAIDRLRKRLMREFAIQPQL